MKSLKVLIVEDNPINQIVAFGFLKKLGHISFITDNGLKGLQEFKNSHYDLILMDIMMPIMDGIEAIKLIREHEQITNTKTPIIIATAHLAFVDTSEY